MPLPLSINTFFFGDLAKTIGNWEIKIEHINSIKHQIPVFIEGYYCPKVLTLSNKEVFEKFKPSDIELIDFVRDTSISLQLYIRNIRISDLSESFIKEFGIKDYHIKLINSIWFNCDTEYGRMNLEIGDKRPFGNSWIEGDILEEVEPGFNDEEQEEDGVSKYEKNEEYYNNLAWKVYDEVMDIFINILKTFPVKYRYFEFMDYKVCDLLSNDSLQRQFFNSNWTISKVYLRDDILNRLINEE